MLYALLAVDKIANFAGENGTASKISYSEALRPRQSCPKMPASLQVVADPQHALPGSQDTALSRWGGP